MTISRVAFENLPSNSNLAIHKTILPTIAMHDDPNSLNVLLGHAFCVVDS